MTKHTMLPRGVAFLIMLSLSLAGCGTKSVGEPSVLQTATPVLALTPFEAQPSPSTDSDFDKFYLSLFDPITVGADISRDTSFQTQSLEPPHLIVGKNVLLIHVTQRGPTQQYQLLISGTDIAVESNKQDDHFIFYGMNSDFTEPDQGLHQIQIKVNGKIKATQPISIQYRLPSEILSDGQQYSKFIADSTAISSDMLAYKDPPDQLFQVASLPQALTTHNFHVKDGTCNVRTINDFFINSACAQKGDILLARDNHDPVSEYIQHYSYFNHSSMFYDRATQRTLEARNAHGVALYTWYEDGAWWLSYQRVHVIRIMPQYANTATISEAIDQALSNWAQYSNQVPFLIGGNVNFEQARRSFWLKAQLNLGSYNEYSYNKREYDPQFPSMYCSKLVWNTYMLRNIDLDSDVTRAQYESVRPITLTNDTGISYRKLGKSFRDDPDVLKFIKKMRQSGTEPWIGVSPTDLYYSKQTKLVFRYP